MIRNDFIEIQLRHTEDASPYPGVVREVTVIADGNIVYRASFKELTVREKGWILEIKAAEDGT